MDENHAERGSTQSVMYASTSPIRGSTGGAQGEYRGTTPAALVRVTWPFHETALSTGIARLGCLWTANNSSGQTSLQPTFLLKCPRHCPSFRSFEIGCYVRPQAKLQRHTSFVDPTFPVTSVFIPNSHREHSRTGASSLIVLIGLHSMSTVRVLVDCTCFSYVVFPGSSEPRDELDS